MTVGCDDLEAALASGDPDESAAARAHATTCSRCAETVATWDAISAAAVAMRRDWSSDRWVSIRQTIVADVALRRRRRLGWIGLATAAAVVLAATLTWRVAHPDFTASAGAMDALTTDTEPLLTKKAVREIERAEANYASAIDRLSTIATPAVNADNSPLNLAQREKLQMLDASIVELRNAIAVNRLNTQLRQQLLAVYREKRETLEEIISDQTTRPTPKSGS